MGFKKGDIVQISTNGVEYIRKTTTYDYDIFLNNLLEIATINDKPSEFNYFIIIYNNNHKFGKWVKKEHIELSKRYYRKEKLKQLRNEI